MTRALRFCIAAIVALGVGCAARAQADGPLTVAERSEFTQTGRHADVMAFLREIGEASPIARLTSLGETFEERDIPLLIVADPPVASAADARDDDRMVVLLFGNIHAGEVCGKEALQMLARELTAEPGHPLLRNLIIAIAPIYNADGNERFSPDNRPGQDGPDEMGQRPNAQGLDLNRDWIKLEAPETRAMVRFFNEWDPAIVVDTHTTNGSLHRYTITYEGPIHPAGDRRLVSYFRDEMMPAVGADLLERTGYRSEVYGNFDRAQTMWFAHPGQPRFGCVYRGMRNRLGILTEAYSYAPFRDRVLATLELCRSILDYASGHQSEIEALLAAADARTIDLGQRPRFYDTVAIRRAVRAAPEQKTILAYEVIREEGQRPRPGEERDLTVDFVGEFYGTRFVNRPFAYIIPAELTGVIEKLSQHGIAMHTLGTNATLTVEVDTIDEIRLAEREFQGHLIASAETTRDPAGREIPAGSVVVLTAQPLGSLACYVLEPEAADGFLAWNLLDAHISEGAEYPILRVPQSAELDLAER